MNRTIFQYLVYGVTICITVIIVTMAFFAYRSNEREIAQQFNNQQLILAKEAAVGIENFFAEIETNMVTLSKRLSAEQGESLVQDVEYSFNLLKNKVSCFFYINPEAKIICFYSSHPEQWDSKTPSIGDYFKEAILQFKKGSKNVLVSDLSRQRDEHHKIAICVPVFFPQKSGRNDSEGAGFRGLLGAMIETSKIVELFIDSIHPGITGYAWLIDKNGTLVYHPRHQKMVGCNIFDTDESCKTCHVSFDFENSIIQQPVAGKAISKTPGSGDDRLLAYSPIRVANHFWSVAVTTPYSEITLLVRRSFRDTMLLITTAVVIIFLSAFYILRVNRKWFITQEKAKFLEQENALQQEIKDTRDYLEQILFSAGEAIISTDCQGLITTWNRASEEMFGYSKQEVIGQSLQLIMPDEASRVELRRQLDKVLQDGSWKGEQLYAHKSNNTFVGWCVLMVVRDNRESDKLLGYISVIRNITEWKQLERSLRESEEKYRTLIEETHDSVMVLQGTEIVYVNPAFLKMFGYQHQSEVLGKSLETNTAPESLKIVKQRAKTRQAKRRVSSHFEYKGLKTNGTKFDIEADVKLIDYKGKPALQAFLRDVTDRKRTEQKIKDYSESLEKEIEERTRELRESQQLLEAISENAPLEIAVVDKERKFVYVNKFWEWITGINRKVALGRKVNEMCPQLAENDQFNQMMEQTFELGQSQDNIELSYNESIGPYKDKEVSKIFWSIPFFDEAVRVNRMAFMGYNVSEIKVLESQLVQSEKLAATGKLVAGIAHEINNPIYGIQGCLESLLGKDKLDPKDKRFINLSYRETQRITGLIKRLQNFYRPSDAVMVQVNLNEIIRDVLLLEASCLKQARIKLHTKYERNLPQILATEDQLKQVIINLISNARDAMPQGGNLTIITKSDDSRVLVNVIDTGIGISKENQSKVFDAFFTTKKEVKGVGLGLSVSYGIISRHNGKIEVESELGKGTMFKIILPAYKTKVA